MSRTLFVLGCGQVGRAMALAFARHGWTVTLARRTGGRLRSELREAGVRALALDRDDPGALAGAVGTGFDAIVDTVAFHAGHARQWISLQGAIGALAVISTGSVYADADGRTLDEARETGFPRFPVPIREDQLRVRAGEATYSTRKVALEDALLEDADIPLVILRPFAVHGPGSRAPREWWFIGRALSGAPNIALAYGGESRFHTSAAANIAELCRTAIERGGRHVLNAADPEALSVAEIGRAILDTLGSTARLTPFAGPPRGLEGATPWSVPRPVIADLSAAATLGYRPATEYRGSVADTCRALIAEAEARGWREAFPGLAAYPDGMFDPALAEGPTSPGRPRLCVTSATLHATCRRRAP